MKCVEISGVNLETVIESGEEQDNRSEDNSTLAHCCLALLECNHTTRYVNL